MPRTPAARERVPTFSVIVPTLGRATLEHALSSAIYECGPGDEIIVAGDGDPPGVADLCAALGVAYLPTMETRDLGCSQRAAALEVATGDYVLFLGDDDQYARGAFTYIREFLVRGWICLQQLFHVPGDRVIEGPDEYCDGMLVVPNEPERFGPWWNVHGGDRRFVQETIENFGGIDRVIHIPRPTYLIRPHEAAARPVDVLHA